MQRLNAREGGAPWWLTWTSYSLSLLAVLALTGCGPVGPATVTRDRFEYSDAVAESWKSQMLFNLVKIRYNDTPVFMDVGQVVAGYQLQRSFSALAGGSTFNDGPAHNAVTGTFGLGTSGSYNVNPTITYSPMSGERFARSFMMPLPPTAILNTIQTGYPVDMVFRLTVQSVNGIDNRHTQGLRVRPAVPEFYALLPNLRRIQESGDIGTRVRPMGEHEAGLTMVFRPRLTAAVEESLLDTTKLLGLDPTAQEYRVVYGAVAANNREIALLSRSILEVLTDLSAQITVPEAHIKERRVTPNAGSDIGPNGPYSP